MRVLQINSFFSVGGPPRIMNGMYDTLKAQGHECRIAAAREKEYAAEDSIHIGNKRDVYFNAAGARIFDNDGFCNTRATKKLIEEIVTYNPDIIHLHNLHGYYIDSDVLFEFLKSFGKPIRWTLHDCWAFTGHCSHFTVAKCEQWRTGCNHCSQLRRYPACYTKGNVKYNYLKKKKAFTGVPNLTIITPSQWLANLVKQSFLKEYPVEVHYNKVNSTVFIPSQSNFRKLYGLEDKKIILGVAQNWDDHKGLDDFIQLAEMLDTEYTIVLVGLTSKQIRTLPSHIIGLPRTNSAKELAGIYSTADVFVNPSKEETFGLTTAEAISCGTRSIVYRHTACEEIVNMLGGVAVEQDIKKLYEEITREAGF